MRFRTGFWTGSNLFGRNRKFPNPELDSGSNQSSEPNFGITNGDQLSFHPVIQSPWKSLGPNSTNSTGLQPMNDSVGSRSHNCTIVGLGQGQKRSVKRNKLLGQFFITSIKLFTTVPDWHGSRGCGWRMVVGVSGTSVSLPDLLCDRDREQWLRLATLI